MACGWGESDIIIIGSISDGVVIYITFLQYIFPDF